MADIPPPENMKYPSIDISAVLLMNHLLYNISAIRHAKSLHQGSSSSRSGYYDLIYENKMSWRPGRITYLVYLNSIPSL